MVMLIAKLLRDTFKLSETGLMNWPKQFCNTPWVTLMTNIPATTITQP